MQLRGKLVTSRLLREEEKEEDVAIPLRRDSITSHFHYVAIPSRLGIRWSPCLNKCFVWTFIRSRPHPSSSPGGDDMGHWHLMPHHHLPEPHRDRSSGYWWPIALLYSVDQSYVLITMPTDQSLESLTSQPPIPRTWGTDTLKITQVSHSGAPTTRNKKKRCSYENCYYKASCEWNLFQDMNIFQASYRVFWLNGNFCSMLLYLITL
jgi:hypothetical protein